MSDRVAPTPLRVVDASALRVAVRAAVREAFFGMALDRQMTTWQAAIRSAGSEAWVADQLGKRDAYYRAVTADLATRYGVSPATAQAMLRSRTKRPDFVGRLRP